MQYFSSCFFLFYVLFSECAQNFGLETVEVKYLLPYIPLIKKNPSLNVSVDVKKFVIAINHDELWCPNTNLNHDKWVASLVSILFGTFTNKCFFEKLIPLCGAKVSKNYLIWFFVVIFPWNVYFSTSLPNNCYLR